ncbi:hypothetical protein NBRC116588_03380 [Pyruvatibacter sp. HU-CL02332]|uniref:hypothetical protein n=1 Tax=Pyruvatibacter sp. HU-CL02332 TaxID=3127650 RepID=UPI0031022B56
MKTLLISAALVAISAPALAAGASGDFPGDRNPHAPVAVEQAVSAEKTAHMSNDDFPGDRNPGHQHGTASATGSSAQSNVAVQADEFPGDRNPHGRV